MSSSSKASDIGVFRDFVGKLFYVEIQTDPSFVLDSFGQQHSGGRCALWRRTTKRRNKNQVWTVDEEGHLICVDSPNWMLFLPNPNCNTRPVMMRIRGNPRARSGVARWTMNEEGEIMSLADEQLTLSVRRETLKNGIHVLMWPKLGPSRKGDKWTLVEIDAAPEELAKVASELHKNYTEMDKIPSSASMSLVEKPEDIGLFKGYIGKLFYIHVQQDPSFVLDTSGRQGQGGPCHIWTKTTSRRNKNQIWTIDREGHLICADYPNWMLTTPTVTNRSFPVLVGIRDNPHARLDSAKWSMNERGEIVSMADAYEMLNVSGSSMANGAEVILWQKQTTKHKNDKWTVELIEASSSELERLSSALEANYSEMDKTSGKEVTKPPPASESASSASQTTDVNQELCVVCLNDKPTHVFVPCGHMVLCEACSSTYPLDKGCPMCRAACTCIIKVFH